MEELLKKIPVSIIALCVVVLTILISIPVIRGDRSIDILGIKIDPRQKSITSSVPVGCIIASYLCQEDMKKEYGDEWELADGKPVTTDTEFYRITGEKKKPDLRGMFLRGLNCGRDDEWKDPEGDGRGVGVPQTDILKVHNHLIGSLWDGSSTQFWKLDGSKGPSQGNNFMTQHTGGVETRPKNTAVYWYIKVR